MNIPSNPPPVLENAADIEEVLRSRTLPPARLLHEIWDRRDPVPIRTKDRASRSGPARQIAWLREDVRLAKRFTEAALAREEFLLVCDAAQEIHHLWSDASDQDRVVLVSIRSDFASALVRLGSTRAARAVLEPYIELGFFPRLGPELRADLLIQIGDTIREESHHAPVKSIRLQLADEALNFYRQASAIDPERLSAALLTAAASLIVAEKDSTLRQEAQSGARGILEMIERAERKEGSQFQLVWSRAIAQTILGDLDSAADAYAKLGQSEGATTSLLADARYRSQFMAEATGLKRDYFYPAFPPLQLIVFAGHQPDPEGTPPEKARFSPEKVEAVSAMIAKKLEAIGARAGVVGACAGADLLFAQALQRREGTLHMVLPWALEDFRESRIKPHDGSDPLPRWTPLFNAALQSAATVRELGQMYEPGNDITWQYMAEVTAGIALNTARTSRLDIQPMALWDGLPGWGIGGTESFVEFWRQQMRVEPIVLTFPGNPAGACQQRIHGVASRCEEPTLKQQVKSMLFADIVGYSKLNERALPAFIEVFLQRVSKLVAESKNAPLSINTWGDAVYAVFDYARQAALFSLELAEMIHNGEEEWFGAKLYWESTEAEGAPARHPLNIRIGLHAGPVFIHYDPVVRRLGFTGAHVNRAARIEPITKPGEVYASEEFAALAELDAALRRTDHSEHGFFCEYAGTMPLAKNYPGRYRIYRVLPGKEFPVEKLARAIHDLYCLEARARGEVPETNSALCSWEALPENVRDANWAQVVDIPNKLRALGYELAPSHGLSPSVVNITDAQLESLAIREHDRWMSNRKRNGWTHGTVRDNARKINPLLVPWNRLTDEEKEKDRDTVRNVPKLIERAGFKIRPAAS